MKKNYITTLPISVALIATVAACGVPATTSAEETGSNRPTASAEAASEPSAAPKDDGTAKFGSTYKWKDGLSVTVSKPVNYKPSDSSSVSFGEQKAKGYRLFTVTVVNKTGKPYDGTLFNVTMQSGNEEMDQVFDSAKKIDGPPSTKLLNGRESKFKIVFGVNNPKDMVMEVSPGFEYDSVIFTG